MSYNGCVEYSHFRYVVAMGDSAFFPLEEFVAVVYLFSNLFVFKFVGCLPCDVQLLVSPLSFFLFKNIFF